MSGKRAAVPAPASATSTPPSLRKVWRKSVFEISASR
jgi:hypothetical protein